MKRFWRTRSGNVFELAMGEKRNTLMVLTLSKRSYMTVHRAIAVKQLGRYVALDEHYSYTNRLDMQIAVTTWRKKETR